MASTKATRTLDERARLGQEVYERQVRPRLCPENDGKFVAVDIDSGNYEIDEDDYTAVMRLRTRLPEAEIWLMRAGFRTAYDIREVR